MRVRACMSVCVCVCVVCVCFMKFVRVKEGGKEEDGMKGVV